MRLTSILTVLGTVAALTVAGTASADDNVFSLHLEPGIVAPLSAPQSDVYSPGVALAARPMFAIDPHFSVGPSVQALYLPRTVDDGKNAGVLWQFGGSARLQTDRRASSKTWLHDIFSPWVDVDVSAAATGDLVRPAFDVGVGAETPLDQNHIAWFGPFVRYSHVFQTGNMDASAFLDKRDANFLQVGLSLSFDTPTNPKKEIKLVPMTVEKTVIVEKQVPVVALKVVDRIDLSEKVYFDFDSSALRWESQDKLDAVVKTLNAHPKLNIQVEGNASPDGQLAHNVQLAQHRLDAVVAYLTKHGVKGSRLTPVNNGVSQPAVSNTTVENRERNRRVEFEVHFTSK